MQQLYLCATMIPQLQHTKLQLLFNKGGDVIHYWIAALFENKTNARNDAQS